MFVEINYGDYGESFWLTLMCATRKTDFIVNIFLRRQSSIFVRENFKDFCGLNVGYEVLIFLNKFWLG